MEFWQCFPHSRGKMTRKNTIEDFWKKVDVKSDNECWEWMGRKLKKGYGQFDYRGKGHSTNRFVWIIVYGEIPKGKLICHSCDNPPCCNPNHLFIGTILENNIDRDKKERYFKKLTWNKVNEIRELYKTGLYTHRSLGKKYGMSHRHMGDIINHVCWKNREV